MAAIKIYVYDEKSVSPEELVKTADADFRGFDELLARLRYEAPKMGNDDDYADGIAIHILDVFQMLWKEDERRSYSGQLFSKSFCQV